MNTTQKGNIYEEQVLNQVKSDTNSTYLWKDVPEEHLLRMGLGESLEKFRLERKDSVNTIKDRGIDIISLIIQCGMYLFTIIQCKNYEKKISESELGSFFSREWECWFDHHKETCCVNSAIYSNSVFTPQLQNSTHFLNQRRPEFLRKLVHLPCSENPYLKNVSSLPQENWKHNDVAVSQIVKLFDSENRVILHNPCRTGKTKVSYKVWEQLRSNFDYLFFFSPLRATTIQSKDAFENFNQEISTILISSDGKRELKLVKKTAYFVCYDSIDIVIKGILDNKLKCLVMVDEFHNLPKNVVMNEEDDFYKLYHSDVKILNISFTPRVYECEGEDDYEDELFGKKVQTITVEEAIQKNIINDFNIYIPNLSESNDVIDVNLSEIDYSQLHDYHCIHWLLHGMLEHGHRKCIYYAQSIEECEKVKNTIEKLCNEFFFTESCQVGIITSNVSQSQRRQLIDQFEKFDGFSFLVSIQILDEGIDIPKCDSVFMKASKNKIRVTQRCMRPLNKNSFKQHPSGLFIWSNLEDEILDTISAVKEIEPFFTQKIHLQSKNLSSPREIMFSNESKDFEKKLIENLVIKCRVYKSLTLDEKIQVLKKELDKHSPKTLDYPKRSSDKKFSDGTKIGGFVNKIRTRYWPMLNEEQKDSLRKYKDWSDPVKTIKLTLDEFWDKNLYKAKNFVAQNQRLPTLTKQDEFEKKIGQWCSEQRRLYKNGKLHQERVAKLNSELDGWYWNKDDLWYQNLQKVKEFVAQNGRIPTSHSKYELEKKIGTWCIHQRQFYKKGTLDKEKIEKLKFEVDDWYWNEDEIWYRILNNVKEFVAKNGRFPSYYSRDKFEKKLGQWCSHQRHLNKNDTLDKKRVEKLNTEIQGWYWTEPVKKEITSQTK